MTSLKQFLMIVVLISSSTCAYADWEKINSVAKNTNLFIDKSTAEISGPNWIKLWHIVDYASVQYYEGKPFQSIKATFEYDCNNLRFRELIRILHAESMGNGMTVYWTHGLWSMTNDPSTWIQPAENSIEASLVTAVCSN